MRSSSVLCCLLSFLMLSTSACNATRNGTYSLADDLPDSVTILETFSDTTGMDSFYLVKARYATEDELDGIIGKFQLEVDLDGVSDLSFAGLFDDRVNIAWFPLQDANRKYEFDSVNEDGTLKDGVSGSYENAMWVDDENRLLVIQCAAK